jgi:GWxTD domain-containing protein
LPVSNVHPGFRRVVVLAVALLLGGSPAFRAQTAAESALIELFAKAKAQFRGGGYEASLATLQKLDEESRAPGLEAAREKLAPGLAFYRGADLAALGKKSEAKPQFAIYLTSTHLLRLDPSMYPKSVLDAFEEAKSELAPTDSAAAGGTAKASAPNLADAYAKSAASPAPPVAIDNAWGEGPIRFLMTPDELEQWRLATDAASRAEFVALFWQKRDPTPQTPENEYRIEIERRLAFADARFAQGEKRGSQTDRGLVFVVMGPPSSVGVALLKIEDDPIQVARSAPQNQVVFGPNGRPVQQMQVTPQPMTAEKIQGTREVWHYRRDRLPDSVRFQKVDFEFLTKEGYGVGVLQREPDVLTALDLVGHPAKPAR